MKKPYTAGIHRVQGRRIYSKRGDTIAVDTIVEVRWYDGRRERGLAVYMFGSATVYRLDSFDCEWELVTLTPIGRGEGAASV